MQLNLYKDGELLKTNATKQEIIDALTPKTSYKFTLTQVVNGKESEQSAPLNVTTFELPTAKEVAFKRGGSRITSLAITTGDEFELNIIGLEDNVELTGADLQFSLSATDPAALTLTQDETDPTKVTVLAQSKSDTNAINMTKITSNGYALEDYSLPVTISALDVPQAPELVWASDTKVVLRIYNDSETQTLNLFTNGELQSKN